MSNIKSTVSTLWLEANYPRLYKKLQSHLMRSEVCDAMDEFALHVANEFSAVEREAVGKQASAEEDFYCTEHSDYGDTKCKTQCPYCEKV